MSRPGIKASVAAAAASAGAAQRPHVLLVNHASYLDAIVLTAILPPVPGYTFTARRALLTGPGVIFIERVDAKRKTGDVDVMAAALLRGDSLLVLPEGTFSCEPGLKPFHAGAFLAAAKAGVPVVVAGLRGTRHASRDETWLPRRSRIEFELGPLLMPAGRDWATVARMRDEARKAMVPLCGEYDPLA